MSIRTRVVAVFAAAAACLAIAALATVQLREQDTSDRVAEAGRDVESSAADLVQLQGTEGASTTERVDAGGPAKESAARARVSQERGDGPELTDAAQELLGRVESRQKRFEGAARAADQPDERSPADAKLIEELEHQEAEESLDELLLETQLEGAQGSLQMLRALNRSLGDR